MTLGFWTASTWCEADATATISPCQSPIPRALLFHCWLLKAPRLHLVEFTDKQCPAPSCHWHLVLFSLVAKLGAKVGKGFPYFLRNHVELDSLIVFNQKNKSDLAIPCCTQFLFNQDMHKYAGCLTLVAALHAHCSERGHLLLLWMPVQPATRKDTQRTIARSPWTIKRSRYRYMAKLWLCPSYYLDFLSQFTLCTNVIPTSNCSWRSCLSWHKASDPMLSDTAGVHLKDVSWVNLQWLGRGATETFFRSLSLWCWLMEWVRQKP